MDSFYSKEELARFRFKEIGDDVRISRKCSIYGEENIRIGDHVRIDDFCILSGRIEFGSYIHIAAYTALYGGDEGIVLGDYANLSSRVTVYSISDDFSGNSMTNPMVPDEYKEVISLPVRIGRHVIIGSTSVVLPGVTLKEGSAFGSFSLIKEDSEEWSMNAGIPAKRIGDRKKRVLELEQQFRNGGAE